VLLLVLKTGSEYEVRNLRLAWTLKTPPQCFFK
jgi:hypothetical protein